MTTATPTRAELYDAIWREECAHAYPVLDAFEAQCGYALDRTKLEAAARVLACPLKANPPNWQHGRVIYAATRRYLAGRRWPAAPSQMRTVLVDIGTAKGFSALCLEWARRDASQVGVVISADVLNPKVPVARNTVAEVDGLLTLAEILKPWPEAQAIQFCCGTGTDVLTPLQRAHVVFVDGKHRYDVVKHEIALITARQRKGDLAIFDDLQLPEVHHAVMTQLKAYELECLQLDNGRTYGVAVRQ